jgi:hypothetical protein
MVSAKSYQKVVRSVSSLLLNGMAASQQKPWRTRKYRVCAQ